MRVLPVHLHLLHYRESSVEVVLDKGVDLLGAAALLPEELVAREGQDLKALIAVFLMRLDHVLVVLGSQPSLAGHIHHHRQFLLPQPLEVELLASDVPHLEVEEAWRDRLLQPLGSRLEDQLGYQASHLINNLLKLFGSIRGGKTRKITLLVES